MNQGALLGVQLAGVIAKGANAHITQLMSQLQRVVLTALQSTDNDTRNRAEQEIYRMIQLDLAGFFMTVANIIGSQQKNPILRIAAATVFKRLIYFQDNNDVFFWDKMNPSMKLQIKDLVLSTLICENMQVMKGGANVIAQIVTIQVPRGEWLDIINTLAQHSQHQEYNIQRASVTTLGYICQEIRNVKTNIDESTCKQILGSLLMGLEKKGEIVDLSLQAIRDSIPFLIPILQNIEFCNKTFQFLMPLMNTGNYREKVYEIMYEFSKYCYHICHNYTNLIIKFTSEHMRLRNDDSVKALTLWETIANEYLERKQELQKRVNVNQNQKINNLPVMAQRQILSQIMGLILILNQNDLDQPELREGVVATLSVIVECGDREMIQKISEGVSTIAQSSNPGQRQATVLLFSTLCSYEDKNQIQSRFRSAFQHFYKLTLDPDLIVVRNTLTGFITLAECFPQVFCQNNELKQILNHLLSMGKHEDEIIRSTSLTILGHITEYFQKGLPPNIDVRQVLKDLVAMFEQGISGKFLTGQENNQKIVVLMMNMLMSTPDMSIIYDLLNHMVGMYYSNNRPSAEADKLIHMESILSIIHTCLLALTKSNIPRPQFRDIVFKLITNHIQTFGIQAQGVNMISVASNCYGRQFKSKIDEYWDKIMDCLNHVEQKPLFRATLTCIADIARTQEYQMNSRITGIFNTLMDIMKQNIDRDLKVDILKCFGDLCLGLKKMSEMFVGPLLEICSNCFEAVERFSQIQEDKIYAQELKEGLVEMYHCLVFAVNEVNHCNKQMANHFPFITTFMVKSNDVKYKPTLDYLKACLYLIYDAGLFYSNDHHFKREIQEILNSNPVYQLVDTIRKFKDRPDVQELIIFIDDKRKNCKGLR